MGRSNPNLAFYRGEIRSRPDGDYIDAIHEKWHGDYETLEIHHGYIQWLFPIFEGGGMNRESTALGKSEAREMREDATVGARVVRSYRLMLDFYGLELLDEATGRVGRGRHWKRRYDNLNQRSHNNLRMTRILTSLGQLGFERVWYKRPLLDHWGAEIESGLLPRCARSHRDFWLPCVDYRSPAYAEKTLEDPEDRETGMYLREIDGDERNGEIDGERGARRGGDKAAIRTCGDCGLS